MTDTPTPLDRAAIRKRAEWGDPADNPDHAIVLQLLDDLEEAERRIARQNRLLKRLEEQRDEQRARTTAAEKRAAETAPRPYDVDELPPGVTCAIGLPGALTPAEIDELAPLREMLERRAEIRAHVTAVVDQALMRLAQGDLAHRSTRATILREYGGEALSALVTTYLIVNHHSESMRRSYGEHGALRVLAALRSEAERVVAEALTAQAATTQAGTTTPPGLPEGIFFPDSVPSAIDLPQQCDRCGQHPGRYATGRGLLCPGCRDEAYPSDGVPASENGDAA